MERRLTFLLALFLSIVLSGCKNDDHTVIHWTLQSHAVPNANDYKQLVIMANKVAHMSRGRFIITPVAGDHSAQVVGPEIFSAVSDGRIEMGNAWPNWWSARHPAWAVLNGNPFQFMNLDASMIFFISGEGTEFANQLSGPEDVIWRPAWWAGMEFGLLSKTPIESLKDLNKKKVRIGPGIPSELLASAGGAFTIPTIPSEIRPALESNALDAVEWTTASGVLELNLQDLSPYAIVPAIWQPSVLSDFLINKTAYNALPEDLQLILDTALNEYTLLTTMQNKALDFDAFEKLVENGTKINRWPEQDLATWRNASNQLYSEYRANNIHSKEIIEKIETFKSQYDRYYRYFGAYDRQANE